MPQHRTKSNVQSNEQQSSVLKSPASKGRRPRSIERKQLLKPVRKSARLQEIQRKTSERKNQFLSLSATNSFDKKLPSDSSAFEKIEHPTPEVQEEHIDHKIGHPINHWIQEGRWPKEYSEQPNFMDLLPRKNGSFVFLDSVDTSCEGGEGTQAAKDSEYPKQLAVANIDLNGHKVNISEDDENLCKSFLSANQPVPENSLFQDNLLKSTVSRYIQRSEALVFRDITPLVVPSAELLHVFGCTHFAHLREEINKIWTKCICLASGPRPMPDFAVGLKSSAFTEIELEKLTLYVRNSENFVKVTQHIFFPFLTCEAKCGKTGITVAELQNAHSASIAVNAVVRLYKAVNREKEIDKKILVFSLSHNHEAVSIHGHYALIHENKISFHRHTIHQFYFAALNGKEEWTAYTFTKNLYDKFLPLHLARIKSAIIQLPDPKPFLVSPLRSGATADSESLAMVQKQLKEMQAENKRQKQKMEEQAPEREQEQAVLNARIDQLMNVLEQRPA